MTNPRRPYRSVDHPLPLQRGPGHPLGFIRTVQGKTAQLLRAVAGLEDRLKYRYGDDTGVPHAYKGEVVFRPRSEAFDIGDGTLANVVVEDSQIQSVPIIMEGPGVFMARYLVVTFYQFLDGSTSLRYPIPFGKILGEGTVDDPSFNRNETQKWSFPTASAGGDNYVNNRDVGVCFFWNLVDRDSERRLSNEMVSQQALLPGGFENQVDGNLFEFCVPWLFERAGMLEFQFNLTTPILQPDGAEQPVMVRVELHGTKFVTERDLLLREAV